MERDTIPGDRRRTIDGANIDRIVSAAPFDHGCIRRTGMGAFHCEDVVGTAQVDVEILKRGVIHPAIGHPKTSDLGGR